MSSSPNFRRRSAKIAGLYLLSCLAASSVQAQYTATYLPWTAPDKTESDQSGTNKCGGGSSQTSMCQNLYVNSADDFCLWAPPEPGAGSTIGDTEQIEVAWCVKSGYGTRLIPDGTLKGVHFVQTPDYVQVTGVGDFSKINIPAGDEGGELDPHGADGLGNPHGGLVFSSAFGSLQQVHEWTNFMSDSEFCIRACKDGNTARAKELCQHIYDVMGCFWNMPGDYDSGVFENCEGDSGEPMGVYGTSTFHQGDPITPSAHPAPASSDCVFLASVGNGQATLTTSGEGAKTTSRTSSVVVSSTSLTTTAISRSLGSSTTAISTLSTSLSLSGTNVTNTLRTSSGSVTINSTVSGSTVTATQFVSAPSMSSTTSTSKTSSSGGAVSTVSALSFFAMLGPLALMAILGGVV